jgi:protein-arginine kinase activator protein McsA
MTLNEKYREFVKQYEQELEEFKEDANQYGGPAEKALAKVFKEIAYKIYPLTIKEWLDRELNEAMEREDFEYAKEIKQEIKNYE